MQDIQYANPVEKFELQRGHDPQVDNVYLTALPRKHF